MLVQIAAPHFVAGIVLTNGIVTAAAPIVKYMHGWRRDKVSDYCRQKRWQVSVVLPNEA